ncbi:MAG: glycosyl transferase family 1, partial [Allomuricauda sp.]
QLGYLPHEQVVEVQQKSQILLLLEIASEETKGIIPGKLFEYLNAKRPILALGPTDWEAGRIVQETKAGISLSTTDAPALKNVLLDWFEQFKKGGFSANSIGIEKFHRRELTKELVNFIAWESS